MNLSLGDLTKLALGTAVGVGVLSATATPLAAVILFALVWPFVYVLLLR